MSGKKNPNNAGRLSVLRAYRQDPRGSLSDLVQATGLSQTAVYYHLNNLQNEGVITRSTMRKIDQRKTASVETNLKKAEAGRKGKGRSAFVAKVVVKSSEVKLQERIEMVVRMAKEKEAAKLLGQDVIRYNRSPLLLSRMQAHKIG